MRAAGSIATDGEKLELLATAIRTVIAEAIAAGGSSLKDYIQADGALGYFQHSFPLMGARASHAAIPPAAARSNASSSRGVRLLLCLMPAMRPCKSMAGGPTCRSEK